MTNDFSLAPSGLLDELLTHMSMMLKMFVTQVLTVLLPTPAGPITLKKASK